MGEQKIKPGDKVDIRILQQVKANKGEIGSYMSSVFDVNADESVEMNMPIQGGKILLLPQKIRYEFVFTTSQGLYKAEGMVVDRYKKQNFYLMKVRFTTKLEKFQRREYYRMACTLPISYMLITEEIALLPQMKAVKEEIDNHIEIFKTKASGTIMDISGGGVRFITREKIQGKYLMILLTLGEENELAEQVELVGEIVQSVYLEENRRYETRIKFLYKDQRCREKIIRFIFEEERRIRKKEQGSGI